MNSEIVEKLKNNKAILDNKPRNYANGWNDAVDFIMRVLIAEEKRVCVIGPTFPEVPEPDMSLVKTLYESDEESCYEYRGVKIYWNALNEGEYTINDVWYTSLEAACKDIEKAKLWGKTL